MKARVHIAAVLTLSALLGPPAQAQEGGRSAIAYAQAVEMSTGVCLGRSINDAADCARDKCVEGGGTAEYCEIQAACFPAGWSVDVFAQSSEGPHWHEFYCGWPSRELALKAAQAACDKKLRPDLIECSAVQLIDEDGNSSDLP